MKTISSIFFWILAAATLLGGGYYFFYVYRPNHSSESTPIAVASHPEDVFVTATLQFPQPTPLAQAPGQGLLLVSIQSSNKNIAPEAVGSSPREFPVHMQLPLRADLLQSIDDGLTFRVHYCPGENTGEKCTWSAAPLFGGRAAEFNRKNLKAGQIDLGTVFFTQHITKPNGAPCGPGEHIISGTIRPTAAFTKAFGHSKFALVVLPLQQSHTETEVTRFLTPLEVNRIAVHTQFLDFSAGDVKFAVPFPPGVPKALLPRTNLQLFGVECTAGDSLDECVARVLQLPPAHVKSGNRFPILAKDFAVPYCGSESLQLYLHPLVEAALPFVPEKLPSGAVTPSAPELVNGSAF